MTPAQPATSTFNSASGSARVGMQIGTVHGDVRYETRPEDPPEERYRVGVLYLDGGVPGKARELIHEAVVVNGYRTSESCFHWLLALMSGRTLNQLSDEDAAKLENAREMLNLKEDDGWADGFKVILRLLESVTTPAEETSKLVNESFHRLGEVQKVKILRHLDLFFTGPLQDRMWQVVIGKARLEQHSHDRAQCSWKFFEPTPQRPRLRHPAPPAVRRRTWVAALLGSVLALLTATCFGVLLIREGQLASAAGLGLVAVGAGLWWFHGSQWRYNHVRRRAKEWEFFSRAIILERSSPAGFTKSVDRLLTEYFSKYLPAETTRGIWLAETTGFRRSLRTEILEVYRESRVTAPALAWLIRHRVQDIRDRWSAGRLLEYRWLFRTHPSTRVGAVAGAALALAGGLDSVSGVLRVSAVAGLLVTMVAVLSVALGTAGWLRIVVERRRFADETTENRTVLASSLVAFEDWRKKISGGPTDNQMADWLDADRKILMSEALTHYKLRASDVLAHAFIEAPAKGCRLARIRNGPWRYSRYRLVVFLLTSDGVRQFGADLDMLTGTVSRRTRMNYRFDAVASVQVVDGDARERVFRLTLVNGEPVDIPVTGATMEQQEGESEDNIFNITFDAAGLPITLHVLEGIAAEGRKWVDLESLRGRDLLSDLTSAIRDLLKSASIDESVAPRADGGATS